MTLHAGHCTTCDTPIWRTVAHPKTGEAELLYPRPDSLYARGQLPTEQVVPGIGYCPAHAPAKGDDGPPLASGPTRIIGWESAGQRYAHWFSWGFGQHLTAWLQDYLELPEHERDAVMAQWRADCVEVGGGRAGS